MMPEPSSPQPTIPLGTTPTFGELAPDAQRGLSLAILRAREGCCKTCDALVPLREALFQALESSEPAPAVPPLGSNGARTEAPAMTP